MINRVELIFLHQPHQVRKFHRDHAFRLEQDLHPATKSFRSGTCASTLLPSNQIGLFAFGLPARGPSSRPKNLTSVGTPFFTATSATLAAGSMPRTGIPLATKYCKQIAVVAGELDDKAVRIEVEALDHLFGVGLRMGEPAVGIRGEIGVLA